MDFLDSLFGDSLEEKEVSRRLKENKKVAQP
jgi:hypothetical protein